MSKYMLLYQGAGGSGPTPDMSEDQVKEIMQAWGTWMEKVGSALVDPGAPTGERGSVGGSGTAVGVNGYSVVEAPDLEAARALCEGHPYLDGAPADFSVDVYELVPLQM